MSQYELVMHSIQGYEIEVAEAGQEENPVIVFAHGLGGNLRQWEDQIHYFSKDFRVLAFSLQGHGNSSKTTNKVAYTIENYGEVAYSVLEKYQITSCIWVGNSMGGVIGFKLIKKHPSLIKHLICNGTVPTLKYNKILLKLMGLFDRLIISTFGYERYVNIAVKASLKNEAKRILLRALFMSALPLAIIESHQLLGDYDYFSSIEKTGSLVTIILTPNDKEINKAISKYRSKLDEMSNVQVIKAASGGHVFNMELADDYNDLVEAIIQNS